MSDMRQTTPWVEGSPNVWERLFQGDLWSLRYRMRDGVWERRGPHPQRLLWVPVASGVGAAQRTTDDLINRFYGVTVDNAVTDMIPRGIDHQSALAMVRAVRTQALKAHDLIEQRTADYGYDRDTWEMMEALATAASVLARWGSTRG